MIFDFVKSLITFHVQNLPIALVGSLLYSNLTLYSTHNVRIHNNGQQDLKIIQGVTKSPDNFEALQ